jgi:hypothetical protein
MWSSTNEKSGIQNGKGSDKGNIGFDTADEEDKSCQGPSDEVNSQGRIETFAHNALGKITGWRIRCDDS